MSSGFFFIYNIADDARNNVGSEAKWKYINAIIVLGPLSLLAAYQLYDDIFVSTHPAKEYHIFSFVSLLVVFGSIYWFVYIIHGVIEINFSRAVWSAIILVMFGSYVLGRTYGLYIRDVSRKYHEVAIKDQTNYRPIFDKAKIVFVTSHHTVLFCDGKTIAIQSNDIAQIVSLPFNWKDP